MPLFVHLVRLSVNEDVGLAVDYHLLRFGRAGGRRRRLGRRRSGSDNLEAQVVLVLVDSCHAHRIVLSPKLRKPRGKPRQPRKSSSYEPPAVSCPFRRGTSTRPARTMSHRRTLFLPEQSCSLKRACSRFPCARCRPGGPGA